MTAEQVRAHGVECEYLAVDMSKGEEHLSDTERVLSGFDNGFLVNNVGAKHDTQNFGKAGTEQIAAAN